VVLTGGPGAGKTAVLALVRHHLCRHVHVLPEAAGILFGGGFPRTGALHVRRAAQRAIFFVQRELEAAHGDGDAAVLLCDRGTVDGAAYWPGPDDLFASVGVDRRAELARYDAVIHLRTPPESSYDRSNPLRLESPREAALVDARIAQAWAGHPRLHVVDSSPDFLVKARRALDLLAAELPACCRRNVLPVLAGSAATAGTQLATTGGMNLTTMDPTGRTP
jgi:predicted ATPase